MRNFSTKNAVENIFGRPANDETMIFRQHRLGKVSIRQGEKLSWAHVIFAVKPCSKSVEKHEKSVKSVKKPYVMNTQ